MPNMLFPSIQQFKKNFKNKKKKANAPELIQ